MNKKNFDSFIKNNFPENYEIYLSNFSNYLKIITEINRSVNLVSRKTSEAEFWVKHFLDSILLFNLTEFKNKKILDFGTGGGMPGIPLKIIFPSAKMYLLDSTEKKIQAVKKMIKKLDLSDCFTIVSRLEGMDDSWNDFFDLIVCRSVKIIPRYKDKLFQLLSNNGEILLYKGRKIEDVQIFSKYKIWDLSHPALGERKIVQIKKEWEDYE
jgi:16S rRNA (guanine527-N7)-methyltransferase